MAMQGLLPLGFWGSEVRWEVIMYVRRCRDGTRSGMEWLVNDCLASAGLQPTVTKTLVVFLMAISTC